MVLADAGRRLEKEKRRLRRILSSLFMLIAMSAAAEPITIGPEQALERAQKGEITIVDIRLPFEWAETGMPDPATGISLQDETLKPRQGFLDDIVALVDGDRDRPIALICARGNRSAFAKTFLAANGFTQLYDISEGMVGGQNGPGWLKRNLPTSPCTAC
jgi:rhodanese-related sulfurtransferase